MKKVVLAICKNIFGNVTCSIDRLTVADLLIGTRGSCFAQLNEFLALISSSNNVLFNSLEAQPKIY